MNLLSWLSRHPLKGPSDVNRAQYTAEVMAKIKAAESPAPAPAPPARRLLSPGRAVRFWLPWPRLSMTLATVAAGILIMMTVTHQASRQLAHPPEAVLIAESPAADDQWLEETLQLLDELDEDVSSETAGDGSEDEWLEELELLDETDLASSS